jgi:hypothetical protein
MNDRTLRREESFKRLIVIVLTAGALVLGRALPARAQNTFVAEGEAIGGG